VADRSLAYWDRCRKLVALAARHYSAPSYRSSCLRTCLGFIDLDRKAGHRVRKKIGQSNWQSRLIGDLNLFVFIRALFAKKADSMPMNSLADLAVCSVSGWMIAAGV